MEEKQNDNERRWVAFVASFGMVVLSLFLHIPQFFGFSFEYEPITNTQNNETFDCWIAKPTW